MFYYLYEIRNLVNNKIYVGVHKTKNLDDGYMGSGKVINRAIEKHGIENFTKVILETFDTSEAMYAREKEVVTEEFLSRKDVYNLRRGGHGGFDYINKQGLSCKGFDSFAQKNRSISPFCNLDKYTEEWKTEVCRKRLLGIKKKQMNGGWKGGFNKKINLEMTQRSLSESSRKKRINTFEKIGHQQGQKNSQFGKMWITNGNESIKILKTESIPAGWRKGRTINTIL